MDYRSNQSEHVVTARLPMRGYREGEGSWGNGYERCRVTERVAERVAAASPRFQARVTGVVYLLFFLTAILGEVFLQQAGMSGCGAASGDAAATATKILAHEPSFRLSWALGLISIACYVAVTALFSQVFRPAGKQKPLVTCSVLQPRGTR